MSVMRRLDIYDLWRLINAPKRRLVERRRKATHAADVQSCVDACRRAARERRAADRIAESVLALISDTLSDTVTPPEPTPAPKPSRITMEGVAHPLPDLDSPDVVDNMIGFLLHNTKHETGAAIACSYTMTREMLR